MPRTIWGESFFAIQSAANYIVRLKIVCELSSAKYKKELLF